MFEFMGKFDLINFSLCYFLAHFSIENNCTKKCFEREEKNLQSYLLCALRDNKSEKYYFFISFL